MFVVSSRLDGLRAVRERTVREGEVETAFEELLVKVNLIDAGLLVEVKNSTVDRSVDSEIRALFSDKQLPF